MLKVLLAHPLTRGLDIDDPHTTHLEKMRREFGIAAMVTRMTETYEEVLAEKRVTGARPRMETPPT
jgi:hypothetical protein